MKLPPSNMRARPALRSGRAAGGRATAMPSCWPAARAWCRCWRSVSRRRRLLVDLRKLPELRKIEISTNGVVLGAMVRWCEILADARLRTAHPLLCAAVAEVAHYQIRNRGTIGGSIAHADPAAEMPGIALVCEAQIATVGSAGARVIQAADFFIGPLMTVLEPDEIIVEIRFPAWPAQRRWGFQEFARRRGDFAMAAAAVWYDQDARRQGAQPPCGRDRGRRPAAAARRGGGGARRPRDRRGRDRASRGRGLRRRRSADRHPCQRRLSPRPHRHHGGAGAAERRQASPIAD